MKKNISILMVFVMMLFTTSLNFAQNTNSKLPEKYGLTEIDMDSIPEGVTPIEVNNEAELKALMEELTSNKAEVGVIEKNKSIIDFGVQSVSEKDQDVVAYIVRGLYQQNLYATVTYDTTTNEIIDVSNIDTDITGYTVGVSYQHRSSFNDVSYSSSGEVVTIESGGHFSYYIIVEGVATLWEVNRGLRFNYSVNDGMYSLTSVNY